MQALDPHSFFENILVFAELTDDGPLSIFVKISLQSKTGYNMEWNGNKLRQRVESSGFTQESFSKKVGVSRPTYNAWIGGQVPKGIHLIRIWDVLGLEPDALFESGRPNVRVLPSHRKRGAAKVTHETNRNATALAESYAGFFDEADVPVLQPVAPQRTPESAVKLAAEMRKLMGLGDGHTPPALRQVFDLLQKLGVYVVFAKFPEGIKDYAFYTQIKGNRVVFVNTTTNELDLIFPLLHEAVHAVRNICPGEGEAWDEEEDLFCDRVAGLVQFPDGYIEDVRAAIQGCEKGHLIDTLTGFAERHHHAIYGLIRRLVESKALNQPKTMQPYLMADSRLRKRHGTLRSHLLNNGHIGNFLDAFRAYSPLWVGLFLRHVGGMTVSRLAECLDLSYVDAKSVMDEWADPALESRTT